MPRDASTRSRLVATIRQRLFDAHGGVCALHDTCGDECDGPLQVDHPWGRDWTPNKVCFYNRWLRYAREHEAGLVRHLCRYHNETIRPRREASVTAPVDSPF